MRAFAAAFVAFLLSAGITAAVLQPAGDSDAALSQAESGGGAFPQVDGIDAAEAGVAAPEWRPGDSWRVTFPRSDFVCRVVVVEADEDGYRQGFACDGARYVAAEEASFDYAFLGRFDRSLGGVGEEESTRWFDWPLEDGKRWRTTLEDIEVEVEARYDPMLAGPEGVEPGFRLRMVHEGEVVAAYDYLPSLGWWSELAYSNGFTMKVDAFRARWSGTAIDADAAPRFQHRGGTVLGGGAFSGTPRDELFRIHHQLSGTRSGSFRITAPDGSTVVEETAILNGGTNANVQLVEAQEGQWTVEFPAFGTNVVVLVHSIRMHEHAL